MQSILDRGRLPIIDLQATYVEGTTNVEKMLALMKEHDVAQIAFAPANAATGEPSLKLARAYPEFFIPATNSGETPRWWRDQISFLSVVKTDLASGHYFQMGEHEFRHYPSPEQVQAGQSFRDISIPIDGPGGHALFKLSEDTGVAFQIHYEIEERLLLALETMLAQYPMAKVIWCHLGMIRYPDRAVGRYGVDYVGSLIERFPNLHFDLAVPTYNHVYRPSGARDSTILDGTGLTQPWRALIERRSDRFLAASDYRPPVEAHYPQQIGHQRKAILARLDQSASHAVAYRNAWRLITGETW